MAPNLNPLLGGGGRIRTYEGISQQIYSLPPLAAWVPLHKMSRVFCGSHPLLSMGSEAVSPRSRGRGGPRGRVSRRRKSAAADPKLGDPSPWNAPRKGGGDGDPGKKRGNCSAVGGIMPGGRPETAGIV
jgi:hypothetical protein